MYSGWSTGSVCQGRRSCECRSESETPKRNLHKTEAETHSNQDWDKYIYSLREYDRQCKSDSLDIKERGHEYSLSLEMNG